MARQKRTGSDGGAAWRTARLAAWNSWLGKVAATQRFESRSEPRTGQVLLRQDFLLQRDERIGVADALRTITLGAAWTLKLDGEIGSIECGKRADFCVLEDDPLTVDPARLKDVGIWGTVQDGRLFPATAA